MIDGRRRRNPQTAAYLTRTVLTDLSRNGPLRSLALHGIMSF